MKIKSLWEADRRHDENSLWEAVKRHKNYSLWEADKKHDENRESLGG